MNAYETAAGFYIAPESSTLCIICKHIIIGTWKDEHRILPEVSFSKQARVIGYIYLKALLLPQLLYAFHRVRDIVMHKAGSVLCIYQHFYFLPFRLSCFFSRSI